MKEKKSIYTSVFSLIFVIILLVNCVFMNGVTNDGTSTGNAQVIGYIYQQAGANLKPVSDAKVSFVLADVNPDSAELVSVITDYRGLYSIDKSNPLGMGQYNVFAEKNDKKVYGKQVLYISNTGVTDTITPLTLKGTGSFSGYIRLRPPHTNDQARVFLRGTKYSSRPDTTGFFRLDSLAPGNYEIEIIADSGGYTPFDSVFTIIEGVADTLAHVIELNNANILPVKGFSLLYDTSSMIAHFSWNKSSANTIMRYRLYRGIYGEQLKPLDSTASSQDTVLANDVIDRIGDTLIYALTALDNNQHESEFSKKIELIVQGRMYTIDSVALSGYFSFGNNRTLDTGSYIYAYDRYSVYQYSTDGTLISSHNLDSILPNGSDTCYIHSIDEDYYGNVYIMTQTYDGPARIRKFSSTFQFLGEAICSTFISEGDSTRFAISSEGYIFVLERNWGQLGEINLYKYDPSFNRENVWPLVENISELSITNDTLVIIQNDSGTNSKVTFYDSDFNLLNTWNVSETMNNYLNGALKLPFIDRYIYKGQGHSLVAGSIPGITSGSQKEKQLLLLNQAGNIQARLRFSENAGLVTSTSTVYSIYDTWMYIYRVE